MSLIKDSTSLYEQDILLWSEDTVAKLKVRDFDHLDIRPANCQTTEPGRLEQ